MERPGSSGGDSGYIRTPPKSEMGEPVFLGTIVAEGTIDGFGKWALDNAGLLVIDGKGKMPDWETHKNGDSWVSTAPWYQRGEAGAIKRVHISDGVTSIGNDAFYKCMSLTSIDIPAGVTSIRKYAFSGCSSLTSIHIPNGVTSIGYDAFGYCSSLTSIHIPDGVTSIENWAFAWCENLTSIHIPDGVISIGEDAFSSCKSLRQVTMPQRFKRRFFKWHYGIPKSIVTFI